MKKSYLLYFIVLLHLLFLLRVQSQDSELIHGQPELKERINKNDSAFCFISQGDEIYYRKWGESQFQGTSKVLMILHGLGYHSSPFMKIMNFVNDHNILVYAMDLRGHGLSGKTRGFMESNQKVLSDIENMLAIIKKENPYSQIYLMGICMGGTYTLGYLYSNNINTDLSGSILIAPFMKLHRSQILQISNLELLSLLIFNHSKPGININGKKLEMSSRDHEWINSRRDDSLSICCVNFDYLIDINQMRKTDKNKSNLSLISLPVFILHGGKDKIANVKGSYYLKKNLINSECDLIIYPESYHTLFWDNDSTKIFTDIVNWIIEH